MIKIESNENLAMKIKWIEEQAIARGYIRANQGLADLLNSPKLNEFVESIWKSSDVSGIDLWSISTSEPWASVTNPNMKGGADMSEKQRIDTINRIRGTVGNDVADRAIANGTKAEDVALAHFQARASEEQLVDMLTNSINAARDSHAAADNSHATTDSQINDIVAAMNAGRGMENC